jgi:vancomycin resistance protein YoaR
MAEAKEKLESFYNDKYLDQATAIEFYYDDIRAQKTLNELNCQTNLDETLDEAFAFGHQGPFGKKLKEIISSYWRLETKEITVNCQKEKIEELISEFSQEFDILGADASAELVYSGNPNYISINPGKDGRESKTEENYELALTILEKPLIEISPEDFKLQAIIASTSAQLSAEEITAARARVLNFVDHKIIFQKDYQKFYINDQKLVSLFSFPDGIKSETINEKKLDKLVKEFEGEINQEASNAIFEYDSETLAVTNFAEDKDGLVLDEKSFKNMIIDTINEIEKKSFENFINETNEDAAQSEKKNWSYDLPVSVSAANIQLKDTNNLGIKEIIGFGESWYYHSIPTRIHNVSVAANGVDNVIVAPGEEFRFNQALGDVSEKTGYQSAYIIQDGQTKLAPGGGVCQVSSTLFRALLDAGLEITRRLPHSYRVEYYEINNNPGFDATVYAGETDLRFINDTDNYVLLKFETYPEDLYMTVKIYGTSDGRSTEIKDYKKWGFSSAPAPQYIPDPSLAPGQLKQIDWAASGIKAEFTNLIYDADGEIIREDYYYSSYQPWAAKYLQGV